MLNIFFDAANYNVLISIFAVQNCQKLWISERVPGATLIGSDRKTLPAKVSRSECLRNCLDEKSFKCRSAKFRFSIQQIENSDTLGTCTLSDADRHLLPNSYRASSFDEEYFENQCVGGKLNANAIYQGRLVGSAVVL